MLLRKTPKKNGNVSECTMCHRYETTATLNTWVVREKKKLVCSRCHPFFKVRFAEDRAIAEAGIDQLHDWLEEHHL